MAGEVTVQEGDVNLSRLLQETEAAALINYTASYAKYVEFPTSYTGTQPPFQPIFEWVDRKWPTLDAGLKQSASGAPLTKRQVAWKVVKIIAANGTDGVYFGRKGLDTAEAAAPAIAAQYEGSNTPKAGQRIVQDIAETGFNKGQAVISQEATDTGNLLQSGSLHIFEDPSEMPTSGSGGGD